MKVATQLASPPPHAVSYSTRLKARILKEIERHDGFISFRRYMEMALYEPGLGYYSAGKEKIGADGDFVTAPGLSPLFSRCLAHYCQQAFASLDQAGSILEFGAGTGHMAADILLHLEKHGQLPLDYQILEVSPHLRAAQQQTLKAKAPHLLDTVKWLDALPQRFSGIVLANEVLDAMPVRLFEHDNGNIYQCGVCADDDKLASCRRLADKALQDKISSLLPATPGHYQSEFNPALEAWLSSLAERLDQAHILLIDYGYPRAEYYHPERHMGTLICHYRHQVHQDYLWYPGLQDITANVDFTAVAEAADAAGLKVGGFTHQADFLLSNGLEQWLAEALQAAPQEQFSLAQQVRLLCLPGEMGERFKVMSLHKNCRSAALGLANNDLLHKL